MVYQDIDLVWRKFKCILWYCNIYWNSPKKVLYYLSRCFSVANSYKRVGYRIHILSRKLCVHLCSIFNKQKLPQDIAIITINDTLLLLLFKSLHFSLQPFPATSHHRDLIATAAVSHRRLDVHLDYGLES